MSHACAEGRVLEWSRRQFLQVTGGTIVGLGLGTPGGGRARALAAEPAVGSAPALPPIATGPW